MGRPVTEARAGERVLVEAIDGPLAPRLAEMGFLPGTRVQVLQCIPLGGPVILEREGFVLALRRTDAESIRVGEAP